MTQVVTVETDFGDLNQMAEGLVGRVDPEKVILPGPALVDAGEWVQFAVTLADGTPGLAGVGRCVTAVDNGEERSEHQRFDVVIDSLQFDPRGQQIFEHILLLSGYIGEDGSLAEEGAAYADDEVMEASESELSDADAAARALEEATPAQAAPHTEAGDDAPEGAYADDAVVGAQPPAGGVAVQLEDDAFDEYTGSALEVPEEVLDVVQGRAGQPYAEEAEAAYGDDQAYAQAAADEEPFTTPGQQSEEPEWAGAEMLTPTGGTNMAALEARAASRAEREPAYEGATPYGRSVDDAVTVPPRPSYDPSSMAQVAAVKGLAQTHVNGVSFRYPGGLPFPAVPPRPDIPASARVTAAPRPAGTSLHAAQVASAANDNDENKDEDASSDAVAHED